MTRKGFHNGRLRRMREVLQGHVDRGEAPGVIALVSRRGEKHIELLGHTEPGGHAPLARDAIFRITSMTKPVTAAAAMVLVEDCKLRLDDPIDDLIPELANRHVLTRLDAPLEDTVPAKRAITVRDLLTFRLGFGQPFAPPDRFPVVRAAKELGIGMGPPRPQDLGTPDAWLRKLGSLPWMHQPGEQWMYNTSADVLGILVARASGTSFEAFLRERIFEPLGMKDTAFSVPREKRERFLNAYATNPATNAPVVLDPIDGQWSRPPAFESGGAGLVSTLDEYFAFTEMLMNLGRHRGERVLGRASVELMTTDQLTVDQKARSHWGDFFESNGWGFGMSVVTRRTGLLNEGSFGWPGGFGTSWAADPREDLVGIVLTQQAFRSPVPPPVITDFWTLAYQAIDD